MTSSALQLGIFNGDAVLLKGKKRKDTVCIALVEEGLEDSSIRMSKVSYVFIALFQSLTYLSPACITLASAGTWTMWIQAARLLFVIAIPRLSSLTNGYDVEVNARSYTDVYRAG